jgi:hypothetical protein
VGARACAAAADVAMSPKIGHRVQVYWKLDKAWYEGVIVRRKGKKQHEIKYADGEVEYLDFSKERWRSVSDCADVSASDQQAEAELADGKSAKDMVAGTPSAALPDNAGSPSTDGGEVSEPGRAVVSPDMPSAATDPAADRGKAMPRTGAQAAAAETVDELATESNLADLEAAAAPERAANSLPAVPDGAEPEPAADMSPGCVTPVVSDGSAPPGKRKVSSRGSGEEDAVDSENAKRQKQSADPAPAASAEAEPAVNGIDPRKEAADPGMDAVPSVAVSQPSVVGSNDFTVIAGSETTAVAEVAARAAVDAVQSNCTGVPPNRATPGGLDIFRLEKLVQAQAAELARLACVEKELKAAQQAVAALQPVADMLKASNDAGVALTHGAAGSGGGADAAALPESDRAAADGSSREDKQRQLQLRQQRAMKAMQAAQVAQAAQAAQVAHAAQAAVRAAPPGAPVAIAHAAHAAATAAAAAAAAAQSSVRPCMGLQPCTPPGENGLGAARNAIAGKNPPASDRGEGSWNAANGTSPAAPATAAPDAVTPATPAAVELSQDEPQALHPPLSAAQMIRMKLDARRLTCRAATAWLLSGGYRGKIPVGADPRSPTVPSWCINTSAACLQGASSELAKHGSAEDAAKVLSSRLGPGGSELDWLSFPGAPSGDGCGEEVIARARRNYATWDPVPTDDEWAVESMIMREIGRRYSAAFAECAPVPGDSVLKLSIRISSKAAESAGNPIVAALATQHQ